MDVIRLLYDIYTIQTQIVRIKHVCECRGGGGVKTATSFNRPVRSLITIELKLEFKGSLFYSCLWMKVSKSWISIDKVY